MILWLHAHYYSHSHLSSFQFGYHFSLQHRFMRSLNSKNYKVYSIIVLIIILLSVMHFGAHIALIDQYSISLRVSWTMCAVLPALQYLEPAAAGFPEHEPLAHRAHHCYSPYTRLPSYLKSQARLRLKNNITTSPVYK